jgi:beta-glucosidase
MTKKIFLVFFLLINISAYTQPKPLYKLSSLTAGVRARDLLSGMTPEEKFWQCFMLSESWELSKDRYSKGVFGFEGGESDGNSQVAAQLVTPGAHGSLEKLALLINESQRFFIEKTRLGIPMIPFAEALHGLVVDGAVSYPQAIGLAATFDTSLMSGISAAIAEEARACGIRMVLSPVVNIVNDPRWGRTEESYGEDPVLSSAMGVAFVKGFEKNGIITCPKHFVANFGEGGRDSYPVHNDERLLEEVYFPPFKACIQQGGARSVMTAYNSLSGVPCTANAYLQKEILKNRWKLDGFVISDAGATGGTNCLHMTAEDYYESTVNAMNNGLDVIFQTNYNHHNLFMPPFLDGSVDPKAIDTAVFRILKAKFQLGLFDEPYVKPGKAKEVLGDTSHLGLALEAARESIVLLKNENRVLPVSKNIKTLAVIGPDAVEARLGGYSGKGFEKISILEGIQNAMKSKSTQHSAAPRVIYEPGCGRQQKDYVPVPPEVLFFEEQGKRTPGLEGEYYDNPSLSGNPSLKRIDPSVDFRWTLYSPDPAIPFDWYSVRWTGILIPPETGICNIGIEGNDGYRLYIDDSLVLDNWKKISYSTLLVKYAFEKNKEYRVKIEFYENSGSARLRMVWDMGIKKDWKDDMEKAVRAARQSEAVVFVAGIEEGEGLDRASLALPGHQEEQILALAATGKPLIIIICGGSAVTMNKWLGAVPAVLEAWYPGEQGGIAVAEVLFGDYNPAGRLPISFPVTEGQLPLSYYHKPTGRNDDYSDLSGKALFPFGFGLSYSNFEYSNLVIDNNSVKDHESVTIHFTLKNLGDKDGDEVPQLYCKDYLASVARPLKELKYFGRVHLKAGESKTLTWTITPDMMSMLDLDKKSVIEPGEFRILIGASSEDIRLRGEFRVVR